MNRKILSMLMILVLALSVVGCAPKQTPKEMLEEATMKSMEVTSAEQDMNMHLSVDLGENPDPMVEMFASMMKDVNLNFHAVSLIEDAPKVAMTGSAALSGMTYNFEVYMNDKQLAMKIPMMEPYIVQELVTETGESLSMNKEQAIEINKKIYDLILAKVTNEELVLTENATVSVNGEDVKVSNIALSLDDAKTKTLIQELFKTMMTDQSFRDIMVSSQMNQMKAMGIETTEEEILAEFDNAITEFDAGWAEASAMFTIDRFDMTFGIDGNKNMVASTMGLGLTVTEPESQTVIKIGMDVDSTSYNINKITEVDFPELNEENSVTADQLGNMY